MYIYCSSRVKLFNNIFSEVIHFDKVIQYILSYNNTDVTVKRKLTQTFSHCFALAGHVLLIQNSFPLTVPSWCRPVCGSLVKAPHARRGTAGSSGLPGASSQTPPCKSHTPALSTWSYLEVVGGMERQRCEKPVTYSREKKMEIWYKWIIESLVI